MSWFADLFGHAAEDEQRKAGLIVLADQAEADGDVSTASAYRYLAARPIAPPYVQPPPCVMCGGTESIQCMACGEDGLCDECWGDGYVDCPCVSADEPDEHACPGCHGNEVRPCACGGHPDCVQCQGDGELICDVCWGGERY